MSNTETTQACLELIDDHGFNAAVPLYFHRWGGTPSEWFSKQVTLYATAHPDLDPEYISVIESEVDDLQLRTAEMDTLSDLFQSRGYFSRIQSRTADVLDTADDPIRWALWWIAQQFLDFQDHGGTLRYFTDSDAWLAVHRNTVSLNVDTAFENPPNQTELKARLAEAGVIWSRLDSRAYPNTPRYRITSPIARAILGHIDLGDVPAVSKAKNAEYRERIQELTAQELQAGLSLWKREEPESLSDDIMDLIRDGALMRQYSPARKRTGKRSRKPSRTELVVPYQVRERLSRGAYTNEASNALGR
ncbi:hypothetical protein [Haloferax elongans]|uniref:hypothetical protein n=1 Tax=Haloferax elongans TaxID=403191 RepID=UPI0012677484|nr:hypothetical protein [Haloferax elongans]